MPPKLISNTYSVSAHCTKCEAIASFDHKHAVIRDVPMTFRGSQYIRTLFSLNQCANCKQGALVEIVDQGNAMNAALVSFYPPSITSLPLPLGVPTDIQAEFREAEHCASTGLNRAASALFRSALEKVLKGNGYTKANDSSLKDLQRRIDAAATDGIITQARQKKAHEDIRALGNDVLHDDWREVASHEVESAHKYTQRVIEDFYDDRETVERILIDKGKISTPVSL